MNAFRKLAVFLPALATTLNVASAQPVQHYPSHTVRIVVPFAAGSVTDMIARIISDAATKRWGRQVIVENRPGAAGTASVASAEPDGHTLLLAANAHAVYGAGSQNVSFDPIKDFTGITRVVSAPLCLVIGAQVPAKSLTELIELAKSKPGKLNFSSAGVGGAGYIGTLLFKEAAGIEIVHVPYRSGPDAMRALISGEAHMVFTPINLIREHVEAGKLRPLAVTSQIRIPQMPDVPTFEEAGLTFVYDAWYGLLAPAGVPRPIIEKINHDVLQILREPEIRSRFEAQALIAAGDTPDQFQSIIRDDAARFAPLLRREGN